MNDESIFVIKKRDEKRQRKSNRDSFSACFTEESKEQSYSHIFTQTVTASLLVASTLMKQKQLFFLRLKTVRDRMLAALKLPGFYLFGLLFPNEVE